MVRGERYGEYGEFFPSGRAGTGNPEPSYGVLILKIFEKKSSFMCSFSLILHLPVRFGYVLSSLYSKNVHRKGKKSNNNGFWNFFFGLDRFGGVRGSPYRTGRWKSRTVVILLIANLSNQMCSEPSRIRRINLTTVTKWLTNSTRWHSRTPLTWWQVLEISFNSTSGHRLAALAIRAHSRSATPSAKRWFQPLINVSFDFALMVIK